MDTIGEIRARIVGLDELARYLDLHGLGNEHLDPVTNTVRVFCLDIDRFDKLTLAIADDPSDPAVKWDPSLDSKWYSMTRSFGGGVALQVYMDRTPDAVHAFDAVDAA